MPVSSILLIQRVYTFILFDGSIAASYSSIIEINNCGSFNYSVQYMKDEFFSVSRTCQKFYAIWAFLW